MKALVIDDSRAMRMILTRTLSEIGYEVVQAANGREALESVPAIAGDLSVILVDWNMPEMNGYDFVVEFRKDKEMSHVPIMMVTSESEMDRVEAALRAGANEYLMKPFTTDGVRAKLMMLGVA